MKKLSNQEEQVYQARVELHKEKIDDAARAKEISEVIFHNNDDIKFMRFYPMNTSKYYKKMLLVS